MALVKSVLEGEILTAFQTEAAKDKEGDKPEDSLKRIAAAIATAVDNYLKTATVSTVVTGTSPSGAVTGTGTGSLT